MIIFNLSKIQLTSLDLLGNLNFETGISISTLDISANMDLDLLVSEEVYF
jgi:hypothetical protein